MRNLGVDTPDLFIRHQQKREKRSGAADGPAERTLYKNVRTRRGLEEKQGIPDVRKI